MLADLDELILKCRDERAKSYIVEAVGCYRADAYRSAIVATWVAVCYDIIDKLRELALAGDKAAEQVLETLDNARQSNDLSKTLKMERDLIDLARDKFELISHLEHVDLDRLRTDRNRCAHPSLISDDVKFSASAELARVHIRAAVTHLLQHPPAQGKFALERLQREVSSEYFPTSTKEARASLSLGPLKRPRESLVRNFVVVLFKWALGGVESRDWKMQLRIRSAIAATQQLHPATFTAVLHDKINIILQKVQDSDLSKIVPILLTIEDMWQHLGQDIRNRIKNYVRDLPDLNCLGDLLDFQPLAKEARMRLESATIAELDECLFFEAHDLILEKYIQNYVNSRSWAVANERARMMIVYASDLSEPQQRRVLAGIGQNKELYDSFEVGSVIAALRKTEKINSSEFDNLLRLVGLQQFVAKASAEGAAP